MVGCKLQSVDEVLETVRGCAAIARRIADMLAKEHGEEDDFAEGAAGALEQLVDVLEDHDDAEAAPAAEAGPDH